MSRHANAAIKPMKYRSEKYLRKGNAESAARDLPQDASDKSIYLSNQYFKENVMNVVLLFTNAFIEKVITKIKIMYRKVGAPLAAVHNGRRRSTTWFLGNVSSC